MDSAIQSPQPDNRSQWLELREAVTLARSRAIQSEDWPLAYQLRQIIVNVLRYADPMYEVLPALNASIPQLPNKGVCPLFDQLRSTGPVPEGQLQDAEQIIQEYSLALAVGRPQ